MSTFDDISKAFLSGGSKYKPQSARVLTNSVLRLLKFSGIKDPLDKRLQNTDFVRKVLEANVDKTSSRKHIMLSLIAYLKAKGKSSSSLENYSAELNRQAKDQQYLTPATPSEKKKYKSFKDLEAIRESFKHKNTPHDDLAYLILTLYTKIPPQRCLEYIKMMVIRPKIPPKDYNEICTKLKSNVVDVVNNHMAIAIHKTSGTYGTKNFDIPQGVSKIINKFSKKYKTDILTPKLVHGKIKNTAMTDQDLRLFLKSLIGMSVSLLRKIYTSDVSTDLSPEERKEAAKVMGHSIEQHVLHYSAFDKKIHKN